MTFRFCFHFLARIGLRLCSCSNLYSVFVFPLSARNVNVFACFVKAEMRKFNGITFPGFICYTGFVRRYVFTFALQPSRKQITLETISIRSTMRTFVSAEWWTMNIILSDILQLYSCFTLSILYSLLYYHVHVISWVSSQITLCACYSIIWLLRLSRVCS
jgi:hypothetical protein